MKAKVLAIGFDGADPRLLEAWSVSGELPTLQALRQRAVRATMRNPPGLGDDATWPSLYTGVSPARHGRYFYSQTFPGSYLPRGFKDADLKHEPFWTALSRAGRRVAILDVPKCPTSEHLNGIHLIDWLAHGHDHPQVCGWPPNLAGEVITRFGPAPKSLCTVPRLSHADHQLFLDRLLASVEMKAALSLHYLEQGNWDLFLTVFKEAHCIGHRAWHVHDPSHPDHDPVLARKLGDPLKRIYVAIDGAIGRLLTRVGPETTVIVFSQAGMGPHHSGQPLLDEILLRLDANGRTRTVGRMKAVWRMLPGTFRQRIGPYIWRASKPMRSVEHSQRRSFTVSNNDIAGAIRVNLVGREPHGLIEPGAEYDSFCATLTRDLLELVNVDTGESVVREVLRTADVYRGEHLDRLPDLLAVWNAAAPIRAARSAKIGRVNACYSDFRSGNHVPDGIVYAAVPGADPGEIPPVSVMDLAPTIAALLGVELANTDGTPLAALRPRS